jgi:two-component system response regulator
METKPIILIEDNPDDVELILRAFKKCNIVDQILVIHEGAEALDYLYGLGSYAGQV